MKLKPIFVNGYAVLVDEIAEIKEGYYAHKQTGNYRIQKFVSSNLPMDAIKIIFAEKELNLDAPILPDWREWEVEQLAEKLWLDSSKQLTSKSSFIAGYNHNKAKYTEEDLAKLISTLSIELTANKPESFDDIIRKGIQIKQSLQKYPKYIVMESENNQKTINYHKDLWADDWQPKLTTNAQGKKVGVIKEIIY